MRLENINWDARDPGRLGRFWAAALGAEITFEDPDLLEARIDLGGAQFLDLCFGRVDESADVPQRLHLDLIGARGPGTSGADERAETAERLVGLGARHVDIGQRGVPWIVLADPEGNAFCVMDHRAEYAAGTGPIAALPLDSADPERDGRFWSGLTGWVPTDGQAPQSLRHPAGVGPLLELCPEPEPRRGKSTLHLDVRPGSDDADLVELVRELGGSVLEQPAPDLPWTVCADPSGNEVCILDRH